MQSTAGFECEAAYAEIVPILAAIWFKSNPAGGAGGWVGDGGGGGLGGGPRGGGRGGGGGTPSRCR